MSQRLFSSARFARTRFKYCFRIWGYFLYDTYFIVTGNHQCPMDVRKGGSSVTRGEGREAVAPCSPSLTKLPLAF